MVNRSNRTSARSTIIKLNSGKIVQRHLDHIRTRSMSEVESKLPELVLPPLEENSPHVDNPVNEPVENPNGNNNQPLRRSSRHRNPPNRYSPSIS